MVRICLALALCALGVAGDRHRGFRATSFVRSLQFNHHLRVCNAYPYAAPLDIYKGKEKLTAQGMNYKSCNDFKSDLKAGDKIEFRVGDANAGTFSVSDLPNNDAVLLLIIHRHDTLSTAVSFESHVFANLLNAQVAIIDTYKGSAKATPKIQDIAGGKGRKEELRYDSVVAVNPGEYEVTLEGEDGQAKSKAKLVALNRESYVLLRVGVDAQQGQKYPQELVVHPQSDASALRGAAPAKGFSLMALAVVLVTVLLQ